MSVDRGRPFGGGEDGVAAARCRGPGPAWSGCDGEQRDVERVLRPSGATSAKPWPSATCGESSWSTSWPLNSRRVHVLLALGLVVGVGREGAVGDRVQRGRVVGAQWAAGRSRRRVSLRGRRARTMRQKLRTLRVAVRLEQRRGAASPRSPTPWRTVSRRARARAARAHSSSAVPEPSPSRRGSTCREQVAAAEVGDSRRSSPCVVLDDQACPWRGRARAHSSLQVAQAVVGLPDLGDVAGDHEVRRGLGVLRRGGAQVHQAVTSRRCTTQDADDHEDRGVAQPAAARRAAARACRSSRPGRRRTGALLSPPKPYLAMMSSSAGDDREQVLEHEQVDERADDRADLVAQERADADAERGEQRACRPSPPMITFPPSPLVSRSRALADAA